MNHTYNWEALNEIISIYNRVYSGLNLQTKQRKKIQDRPKKTPGRYRKKLSGTHGSTPPY